MTLGYDKPLYVPPFNHRGTFQKNMFGWTGTLTAAQTAEIVAAKQSLRRLQVRGGGRRAEGEGRHPGGRAVRGGHPQRRSEGGLFDGMPGREERSGRVRFRIWRRRSPGEPAEIWPEARMPQCH